MKGSRIRRGGEGPLQGDFVGFHSAILYLNPSRIIGDNFSTRLLHFLASKNNTRTFCLNNVEIEIKISRLCEYLK